MILLKGKFVENERGARNVLSVHAENMRRSVLQICGSSFNRFALFCCGDLRHSVGVICGVWRSDLRYFTEEICGKQREQQIKYAAAVRQPQEGQSFLDLSCLRVSASSSWMLFSGVGRFSGMVPPRPLIVSRTALPT